MKPGEISVTTVENRVKQELQQDHLLGGKVKGVAVDVGTIKYGPTEIVLREANRVTLPHLAKGDEYIYNQIDELKWETELHQVFDACSKAIIDDFETDNKTIVSDASSIFSAVNGGLSDAIIVNFHHRNAAARSQTRFGHTNVKIFHTHVLENSALEIRREKPVQYVIQVHSTISDELTYRKIAVGLQAARIGTRKVRVARIDY